MKIFNLSILSKIFLFIFVLASFFLFSAFSSKPAYAALCGTAGHPKAGTVCSAPACNGTGTTTLGCQMKTWHDNAGNCDCGWGGSLGIPATGCTPADCGKTPAPLPNPCNLLGASYSCNTISSTCVANPSNTAANAYCATLGTNLTCCIPAAGTGTGTGTGPGPVVPPPSTNSCPICAEDYTWDQNLQKCTQIKYDPAKKAYVPDIKGPTPDQTCTPTSNCEPGCGCDHPCGINVNFNPGQPPCPGGVCDTAIGNIKTDFTDAIQTIFQTLLAVSTLVAIVLIIFSAYRLLVSQGNPENVQKAREQLTAAIVGLLFTIFAFVILQLIGVSLLGLPGLKP